MATDNELELQPILTNRKASLNDQPPETLYGEGHQKNLQARSAYRTVLRASALIFVW